MSRAREDRLAPAEAGQRHARVADRLDRLRQALVRPLCVPAFLAAAGWAALTPAGSASHVWVSLLTRLAMALSLLSPVCLAVAVVLTAVSSKHRPLREVRIDWTVLVATLGCTAFALASLAGHMAER